MTWYVVCKDRVPGVYDDWEQCRKQVHGFSGNNFKGYNNTMMEAEARYATCLDTLSALNYLERLCM